ncbi:MAG: endolytic transglycosylase MltG [Pseudomonadota bacterium]
MIQKTAALMGLALCLILAGAGALFLSWARQPPGAGQERVMVEIPRGQPFFATVRVLSEKGLVDRPRAFRLLARLTGSGARVQAGEYALSSSMSPLDILAALANGRVVLHRLTVPEGLRMTQVAALVGEAGLCPAKAFLARATDPAFARSLGVEADSLEGFLFPETYRFPRPEAPERVLAAMAAELSRVFIPDWEARAAELGMTRREVVTLASIIEKEAARADEQPIISSVFHNRLAKKMPLQADPTVIYGIENFNGNLTRKDLETPTPYNTYVHRGLPPGPIANPGRGALWAALNPAATSFLYFVARADGTHQFSSTLREHRKAVYEHQISRTKKR